MLIFIILDPGEFRTSTFQHREDVKNMENKDKQGDQLYLAVWFWYLVKSVRVYNTYSSAHWQSHFLKVPEIHGHVYLFGKEGDSGVEVD